MTCRSDATLAENLWLVAAGFGAGLQVGPTSRAGNEGNASKVYECLWMEVSQKCLDLMILMMDDVDVFLGFRGIISKIYCGCYFIPDLGFRTLSRTKQREGWSLSSLGCCQQVGIQPETM